MADAFGRWLEHVLGDRGLMVYDSSDPAAKPLVSQRLRARAVDRRARRPSSRALAGADLDRARLSRAGARAGRQPGAVPPGRRPPRRFASRTAASSSATEQYPARDARRAGQRTAGRVQPERAAAADRAGHALSDDLLCRRAERARLPRTAARGLRALRRADAADVSAGVGDAPRFGGAPLPHEVQAAARSAAGAGRSGAERAAQDPDSAGRRGVVRRRVARRSTRR